MPFSSYTGTKTKDDIPNQQGQIRSNILNESNCFAECTKIITVIFSIIKISFCAIIWIFTDKVCQVLFNEYKQEGKIIKKIALIDFDRIFINIKFV